MNRPIGFSTGALAKGDFRRGLSILRDAGVGIVELSALRAWELEPLVAGIDSEDLNSFSYISIHAPSAYKPAAEPEIVRSLEVLADRGWPVIVHPDAIHDFEPWQSLGPMLLVENMDMRKSTGRNVRELERIFERLPGASFCFDAGHARQVDPTMCEGRGMLRAFAGLLRQLHVSEVSSASHHERLSLAAVYAFQEVYSLVPNHVPLILETPVPAERVLSEIATAREALPLVGAPAESRR